jgi:hypothetical protein
MNLKLATIHVGRFLEKNSTQILTGVAIAGTLSTTIFAVKATPKAVRLIEQKKLEDKVEIVKETWKLYIPAALSFTVTTASIIGINTINSKRQAALAGLYSLAQTTFKEYQAKVIEQIGENKERKVRDAVDADKILTNPPEMGNVIITGAGDVLCYDSVSGRYFKSDIEKIRQIVNELNRVLLQEMFIPLNDFYYELGLEPIQLGNSLGFNVDNELLDVKFSSHLTKDGKPCLVMNYEVYNKDF